MKDIQIKEPTYVKDLGNDKWVMIVDDEATIVTYSSKKSNGLHSTFENALNTANKAKKFSGNQIGLYQCRMHWNEKNELVSDLIQVGVV